MAEGLFSHLAFLSREHPVLLEERLGNPGWRILDRFTQEGFTSGYKGIMQTPEFPEPLKELLMRHLVAEYQVFRDAVPASMKRWLQEHLDLEALFPSVEGEDLLSGRWHAAPVILTANRAHLLYFMAGLVTRNTDLLIAPRRLAAGLGEDTLRAIESAAEAACRILPRKEGEFLCCYPLWAERDRTGIEGGSLGLPMALGFLAALSGEKSSGEILATGAIEREGAVGKVSGVDLKVNYAAEKRGFRAFLYPAENHIPAPYEGLDFLPVSNLREAWLFYSLYHPGRKRQLPIMSEMMENPVRFADNCGEMPAEWVEWTARNGLLDGVVKEAIGRMDLADSLVNSLESCIRGWKLENAAGISGLLDADGLDLLAKTSPAAAFRWSALSLSLANHRGDIEAADLWTERAFRFYDRARGCGPEIFADFHNYRLVSLQNRYRFGVQLPQALRDTLGDLESHYEINRKKGYPVHKKLGELYGSIAQNYGFCGTQYLDDTIQYAHKARRAFGDGEFPEQREDWLRQFNYVTYAYLDAREFRLAERALLQNLEMEGWEGFVQKIPGFSRWQHGLTARYLGDAREKGRAAEYLERMFPERSGRIEKRHPRQLWLYNLGRVAAALGDPQKAETLYRESLDLCLSEGFGPTVRVMALLPLSGLFKMGALDLERDAPLAGRVRDAAEKVNPGHFRAVVGKEDFSSALEAISENPQTLFPFSYR